MGNLKIWKLIKKENCLYTSIIELQCPGDVFAHFKFILIITYAEDCRVKNCTHHCMIQMGKKASCMCKVGYISAPSRPNECIKVRSSNY